MNINEKDLLVKTIHTTKILRKMKTLALTCIVVVLSINSMHAEVFFFLSFKSFCLVYDFMFYIETFSTWIMQEI